MTSCSPGTSLSERGVKDDVGRAFERESWWAIASKSKERASDLKIGTRRVVVANPKLPDEGERIIWLIDLGRLMCDGEILMYLGRYLEQ